jgi:sulfide:quinone oxidoreductase
MGHGTCTCQGAAFEYTFNVEDQLVKAGVRDRAEVIYITNESQLGDFGMDGMNFGSKDGVVPSQMFTESLFQERGVKAILSAHVESGRTGHRPTTNRSTAPRESSRSTSPCCCRRSVGST